MDHLTDKQINGITRSCVSYQNGRQGFAPATFTER